MLVFLLAPRHQDRSGIERQERIESWAAWRKAGSDGSSVWAWHFLVAPKETSTGGGQAGFAVFVVARTGLSGTRPEILVGTSRLSHADTAGIFTDRANLPRADVRAFDLLSARIVTCARTLTMSRAGAPGSGEAAGAHDASGASSASDAPDGPDASDAADSSAPSVALRSPDTPNAHDAPTARAILCGITFEPAEVLAASIERRTSVRFTHEFL